MERCSRSVRLARRPPKRSRGGSSARSNGSAWSPNTRGTSKSATRTTRERGWRDSRTFALSALCHSKIEARARCDGSCKGSSVRKHGRFGQLAPHIDPERFHRIVSPENLAAARLDTGYSARIDNYGCLDLTFASDGEIVVVPYVILQGIMLFAREGSPFVWPSWLPPVRSDALRAIEAFVEPWLRSLAVARFVNGEIVKLFGKDERAHRLFEKARDYGFLGAAPTERVVELNAPYVYALRFAANKRVAISDRNGAGGAALLARVANVDANVKDKERADAARHWFG